MRGLLKELSEEGHTEVLGFQEVCFLKRTSLNLANAA